MLSLAKNAVSSALGWALFVAVVVVVGVGVGVVAVGAGVVLLVGKDVENDVVVGAEPAVGIR